MLALYPSPGPLERNSDHTLLPNAKPPPPNKVQHESEPTATVEPHPAHPPSDRPDVSSHLEPSTASGAGCARMEKWAQAGEQSTESLWAGRQPATTTGKSPIWHRRVQATGAHQPSLGHSPHQPARSKGSSPREGSSRDTLGQSADVTMSHSEGQEWPSPTRPQAKESKVLQPTSPSAACGGCCVRM